MNPFLIAGLLGAGAGFLSRDKKKSRKKMARGGEIDEDILVVDVVWRQLNEKGLGKFRLKESDVERLEDNYGSTYYFEPYDYTNEKPISYTKMKNILDKSMKEMGLMDSNFAKGGMIRAFDEQVRELEIDPNDLWDKYDIQSRLVDGGYEWDEGSDDWQYYLDDIEYGIIEDKNGKVIGYLPFDEIDMAVVESFSKGGTTSDAEERAFAKYMEDYGVDREEADEQFLGEFDNKEQWAAEYVDDIGGIEQFADPERYLEIDYTGFEEFAMNQAKALSMDLEDYDIEKIAKRHGLAFEYMEAEGRGGVEMENFRARMEEKEYEDSLAFIMDEGESVEGVLGAVRSFGVGGVEEAIDQHVVEVDYVEVADALEGDGFEFIEEDFKTFVFNPNMARGGRTKRMKKGGKVDYESRTQKDFDLGEIVYNVEEDNYGTIIGMSSHPLEVRLDTDGMQGTSFLRKLGEKGDVGSKAQLFDEVSYYVNIRKQNPERKFPPLINNPFYAKGGTTSDAEERAFAKYMEDYGVDREEADEQFLGEFDNKGQWAAEFVDDTGGMESLIDPERFYRIDKVGFREWAMNMAESMSEDIDEDNAVDIAENLGFKFDYSDAFDEDKLGDFIQMVQEKDAEATYDNFMANYTTADEIINELGPSYGMGLDDLEDAYLIMPDYDEVADALEDDGYVFIEKDFKTFVFNPNMARGGRTKRMKKGGKVDYESRTQKDFDLGEIVYNVEEDNYGTIIGMSSHPLEVRLDTDGMQGTSFLRKLGEKGDVGSKAQLFDEVSYYVNIRKQNPERKFPPLINNPFYAKGGKVKGLDKYGSWYYMDDDGTLFVRYQEVGEDKAPKWDEDDDEWGVVEERAFDTMERQEFEKDMKKLFGRKPKLS